MNQDNDGDGICDLNCDTDNDGFPDKYVDTTGDGICNFNCKDNDSNLNIDTDGDGICNLNCDTDGDGKADSNIYTDGDGVCDINCTSEDDKLVEIKPTDENLILYVSYVKSVAALDVEPGWSATQNFIVSNQSSKAITFNIKWTDVYNGFDIKDSLVYTIKRNNIYETSSSGITAPTENSYMLNNIVIPANTSYNYEITYNYKNLDINQNADQGKTFTAKIEVEIAN
jgi:hypothetical protein